MVVSYFGVFIGSHLIESHLFEVVADFESEFFVSEPHVLGWDETC